jgi:sugar fermentation stimulation protein A
MNYPNIHQGRFLSRPNRFIAHVMLNGEEVVAHVKNTGRCKELLLPGAEVYLVEANQPTRKTKYDLVAVKKQDYLINMDSQAPNQVFQEWAASGAFLPDLTLIRPEYRHGDSRFDFYLEQGEKRHLVEVKGVTLEENGIVRFPDAPTQRGVKHIEGLIAAKQEGFEPWLCFVVQLSPVKHMEPNDQTHPAFGDALRRAKAAGVHILAMECQVEPGRLTILREIPVKL